MQIAQVAVLALFLALTIAGCFAVAGLLPVIDGLVLSILYWFLALGAVGNTMQSLARAALSRDQRKPGCEDCAEWPRTVSVQRWLWRGLLVLAFVYGHYGLAALLAYTTALGIASRVENRLILGDERPIDPVSRTIHRLVYAIFETLAPVYTPMHRLLMRPAGRVPLIVWVLALPLSPLLLLLVVVQVVYLLLKGLFAIPFLLFDWRKMRDKQRELVRAAAGEGKLAWFAYSEPHQFDHFMGEAGVLHGLGDAVLVRDWRADLADARQHDSSRSLDALIIERLRLSNMRDDLPVVVLLEPDGRLNPFHLNRAYRQRLRDGGDLLRAIEEKIRECTAAIRPATCSPA